MRRFNGSQTWCVVCWPTPNATGRLSRPTPLNISVEYVFRCLPPSPFCASSPCRCISIYLARSARSECKSRSAGRATSGARSRPERRTSLGVPSGALLRDPGAPPPAERCEYSRGPRRPALLPTQPIVVPCGYAGKLARPLMVALTEMGRCTRPSTTLPFLHYAQRRLRNRLWRDTGV